MADIEDNRFEKLFRDQLGMVDSWIDELRKAYEARNEKRFGQLVGDWCSMAGARDSDGKQGLIREIIQHEIYARLTRLGKDSILTRARELAKMNLEVLDQRRRKLLESRLELDNMIDKATYQALGKKPPAWLKQNYIEDLADEYVLPEMKLYSGDKLSLAEIKEIVSKSTIAGDPPVFTDQELEAALDYLESAGEILSFEKTAEKPRRWTALEIRDSGVLAQKEVPKLIEVYKTTIVKHYRAKAAFHKGSFRVLKPNKNTLIYLGCLKTDDWKGKTCSENQTLHKTIVNKTDRGLREVKKLEGEGIQVKYFAEEGIQPRAEDDILDEIAQALNKTQTI